MEYALVTGGSRGIGRAICLELCKQGLDILINYRSNKDEAEKTLTQIKESGGNGTLLPFDVSNPDETAQAMAPWTDTESASPIRVLVNNAGITRDNLMLFMENKDFDDILKINLNSFFYVTKTVLKQMAIQKKGRIINIASESGLHGLPGQVNYSAAKGGLIAATKALALEMGKKNITVNAIAAGFIKTDMTAGIDEKDYKKVIPLGRFGTPEEVAHLAGFLASEKAGYITGQVIEISGGLFT